MIHRQVVASWAKTVGRVLLCAMFVSAGMLILACWIAILGGTFEMFGMFKVTFLLLITSGFGTVGCLAIAMAFEE